MCVCVCVCVCVCFCKALQDLFDVSCDFILRLTWLKLEIRGRCLRVKQTQHRSKQLVKQRVDTLSSKKLSFTFFLFLRTAKEKRLSCTGRIGFALAKRAQYFNK